MSFSAPTTLILQQEINKRRLPVDFMSTVKRWYHPVAEQIVLRKSNTDKTFLVSFNGAQGSGKSTMTAFLRLILRHHFNVNTVEVSMDDFYLTRQQRHQLASEVHPLFKTRGVPGTHDIPLAVKTFNGLRHCSAETPCAVPVFDKASDDRKPESEWTRVDKKVDVILFEGWCNHAPVESSSQLEHGINELEIKEDSDGLWRTTVNRQLAEYHRQLFAQAGLLIYLKVPSFEKVYEWRGLQEKKLALQYKQENEQQSNQKKHAVMNEVELQRFIQHYERITRRCLQQLPSQADIVLYLNASHGIDSMQMSGDGNV